MRFRDRARAAGVPLATNKLTRRHRLQSQVIELSRVVDLPTIERLLRM